MRKWRASNPKYCIFTRLTANHTTVNSNIFHTLQLLKKSVANTNIYSITVVLSLSNAFQERSTPKGVGEK